MATKRELITLLAETVVIKGPLDWKGVKPHGQIQNDDGTLTDLVVRDLVVANLFIRPEAATEARAELVKLLTDDAHLYHLLKSADTSSYIQLGAELGDQGAALKLLALGEYLGLWNIYTPKTIFGDAISDETNVQMIGSGYLSTDGQFRA